MKHLFATLILLVTTLGFAGQEITLSATKDGDLVGSELVVKRSKDRVDMRVSQEPVSMSWSVHGQNIKGEANPVQLQKAKAHIAESKSFYTIVTAADFNEGISLPVADGGALVRISPQNAKAQMFAVEDLVLVNQDGRSFSNGYGVRYLIEPDQRRANKKSHPFPERTAVFQMQDIVGAGEVLIFADNLDYNSDARYLVEVLERDSQVAFRAQTGRPNYLVGQTLTVSAEMLDGADALTLETITGTLVSPTGKSMPLSFVNDEAQWPLTAMEQGPMGALWEVRVTAFAQGKKGQVRRDVRTAFAMGETTARFAGRADIERTAEVYSAKLDVEAGVAGRFEVRGTLFGTNEAGKLEPIAEAHSADWLDAGEGMIDLRFDNHLVKESGLNAPYVVRDLRLIHQNRMSLIHQQEDGFVFDFQR